jgi:hypothetical protein
MTEISNMGYCILSTLRIEFAWLDNPEREPKGGMEE